MESEIEVNGMHCSSCEALLKEGLMELEGVNKVEIVKKDARHIVRVSYDDTVHIGDFEEVIRKNGFEPY
ncbi:heavy-metal-associated domain-containing protein [Candidatus Woesearchaeota archaeon]|nr:heavy-metal-associated domain-containing protein [Candidatus Woesearchaeota archaeon]